MPMKPSTQWKKNKKLKKKKKWYEEIKETQK